MELFLKWLPCVCSIAFIKMSSSKFQSNMEILWNACILNEYALHMYSVSLPKCIYECKLRPGCSSINYNVRKRRCEINDNSWSLHTETCTGTLFSKRSDWTEENLCGSRCANGTKCELETGTCQLKECQPLVVDHSEVWGKLRRIGDTQLVTCENDKSIAKHVNCLHDGSWNQIPECPAANTANTNTGEDCSSYKVSQWVTSVTAFSSEYFLERADQVIGPPDVYPSYGDLPGVWAQENCLGSEFIELEFQQALFIGCIAIYETYHGGKVKKILSRKANETHWHELWSTTKVFDIEEARIFSPSLTTPDFKAKHVRLEIDCSTTDSINGYLYAEIDAVMIGGEN